MLPMTVVGYAKKKQAARMWIQNATKNRGGLHRALGIPEGRTIPLPLVRWAAKQPGRLGKQGRLALTLRRLNPHISGDHQGDETLIGTRPLMPGVPRRWGPKEFIRSGKGSFWANAGIYPPGMSKAQIRAGTRREMVHTSDPRYARELAIDRLMQDRNYYRKLARAGL